MRTNWAWQARVALTFPTTLPWVPYLHHPPRKQYPIHKKQSICHRHTVPYTKILTVWVQLIQLPVQAPNHATSEEVAAYTTSWHTQTKEKTCQAWSGELCVVLAVGSRRDASVFAARPQRVQRGSVHNLRSHSVYIFSRCKSDHRLLVNTPFWTHDEGKTWQLGVGTAWHNHQIWGPRTAQPRQYSHVLKTH